MPRVSEENKEKNKNEILDVCESLYKEQGFQGVTIKEISTKTSFTRPAIYSYFETKDEILLGLLIREYKYWVEALKAIASIHVKLTRKQIAEEISHTLEDRTVLLRLENMNLYEIEINSRVERLAEFKVVYGEAFETLSEILKRHFSNTTEEDRENIILTFFAFLFGVYPFVFHTDKQLDAMKAAGISQSETSIYKMLYECLIRILPEDQNES